MRFLKKIYIHRHLRNSKTKELDFDQNKGLIITTINYLIITLFHQWVEALHLRPGGHSYTRLCYPSASTNLWNWPCNGVSHHLHYFANLNGTRPAKHNPKMVYANCYGAENDTVKWRFEHYASNLFCYVVPLKCMRWKMKTPIFEEKRRRHMSEKYTLSTLFGHGCVASHVASDFRRPPPPGGGGGDFGHLSLFLLWVF